MRDYRTIRCDPPSHERGEFIYRIYLIDFVIFKMLYEKSVQQPWNGLLNGRRARLQIQNQCVIQRSFQN